MTAFLRPLTAAVALLCGCAAPLELGVDTTYVIEDLDAETMARLRTALRCGIGEHCYAVLRDDPDAGRFEFRLSSVADASVLKRVHAVIRGVSHDAKVPLVLQGASLLFSSVQGSGDTEILIDGAATPGAEVVLDIGGTTIRTSVGANGLWTASVPRSPGLRARDGWIYGMVIKGRATQYLSMNVLDGGGSHAIARSELPRDSPLRDGE